MSDETKKFSIADIANMNTLKPGEEADDVEMLDSESYVDETEAAEDSEGYTLERVEEVEEEKEEPRMVHTENAIAIEATPSVEDMSRFMFVHTYLNPAGIFGLLLSIGAIVIIALGYGNESTATFVLLMVIAVLFIVVSPINIIFRARKHSKASCGEGQIITYTISDAGIDLSRNTDYVDFKWDRIFKVVEGKTALYVYVNKNQAFVLPKHDFEGKYEALRTIFEQNIPLKRCHFHK